MPGSQGRLFCNDDAFRVDETDSATNRESNLSSYPDPTPARAIGGFMLTAASHRIGVRSLAEQLRVARNRLCAVADFMVASRGDDGLAKVVWPNVSVNEAAQTRPSPATYIHRLMSASRGPTSTYRTRRLGCRRDDR